MLSPVFIPFKPHQYILLALRPHLPLSQPLTPPTSFFLNLKPPHPTNNCHQNPEYILVKRWVPKDEQNDLWSLTKVIRGERERVTTTLHVEDRTHGHHRSKSRDKNLVLVRKKHERSRSPNVLMYIAGASR